MTTNRNVTPKGVPLSITLLFMVVSALLLVYTLLVIQEVLLWVAFNVLIGLAYVLWRIYLSLK